jgi:hypothetical protein
MNSKFSYLYRDASNYKQFGDVVFPGGYTEQDKDLLLGNLHDGDFFIPGDVGLPSLQSKFGSVSIDDHPWHEINFIGETERSPFELTREDPNDVRSVHQFAEEFAKAKWDEMKASRRMGLI